MDIYSHTYWFEDEYKDISYKRLTIEYNTAKDISIETRLTPENIARCNPQIQSPLFGKLPPEIRNRIFSLALLQYEDLAHPYAQHDFCYRPGHRARRIISTGLLKTCRLVWLEANHWPMAQAVHTFWQPGSRRPGWSRLCSEPGDRLFGAFFQYHVTGLQRPRIKHIHVFAQVYWLENDLATSLTWKSLGRESLNLDSFMITIRHTDWARWETDAPLRLKSRWIRKLLACGEAARISEFRLELETLDWKVDQLRPIVDNLRMAGQAKYRAHSRWELIEPFEEYAWSGPVNLGGREHSIYAHRDKLDYRVITMKWRLRGATDPDRRWREEGSLLKLCEPSKSRIYDESSDDSMAEDGTSDDEQSD